LQQQHLIGVVVALLVAGLERSQRLPARTRRRDSTSQKMADHYRAPEPPMTTSGSEGADSSSYSSAVTAAVEISRHHRLRQSTAQNGVRVAAGEEEPEPLLFEPAPPL
jgi:hypothetical protein